MIEDPDEQARRERLIRDAFARGQAALTAGDKIEAVRWLDRGHRLAPGDGTITLLLASALIGDDNVWAAVLFAEVLGSADVRDAWLGLATARFLSGDLPGAHAALAETLGRHASRPDAHALADQVARSVGAPGWCGLTGDGVLSVHQIGSERVDIRVDGTKLPGAKLGEDWRRQGQATVTVDGRPLIGSPISLRAIGRVEGHVEAWEGGIRGWAWHPGDPDADPRLSVAAGRVRTSILATHPVDGVLGLPPLGRPRSIGLAWTEFSFRGALVHLRGADGRALSGSPVSRPSMRTGKTPPGGNSDPRPGETKPRARDMERWRTQRPGTVILITHGDGGGVERRIQGSIATHGARGRRAIVLRPTASSDGTTGITVDGDRFPDLRFELPRERNMLLRLLLASEPVEVELHHFLNHDPSVFQIVSALKVPYDVHVHDFAWFCPRIALVGDGERYCGEPAVTVCETCVEKNGTYLREKIRVADLARRSQDVLGGARRVIAPSRDAAERMALHFPGLVPEIVPHEDDATIPEPPPIQPAAGTVQVCVAGAIGLHKGFHVLLACARDARKRDLDLSFVVAGTTIDDQRLMDTGKIFVTGPYRPEEAVALIRAQAATLALLPSIWPETWCLGLTELWRAGLRVAAFDIGAQAERIRRTGRGFLLPLGLPPSRINDVLLNAARGRSFLPIRRASSYKAPH